MDTLHAALALTTILAGGVALIALRHAAKQGGAYREAQAALLEATGDRAAAVEAATRAEREIEESRKEMRLLTERAAKAERDVAVSRSQAAEQLRQMQDWEAHKQQMQDAAKAAILQTSQDISTKLLADHKQENEAAKKQSQEITAKLFEQFHQVTGRVEAMAREGGMLKEDVGLMMRTMTHPGGAGKMAEVGLENLLKSFGFELGRDFDTQFHIASENGALRPDAIVYLPQNMVLVIDSKASKFMVELIRAEGTEGEAAVFDQFRKTMRDHAKALVGKDYRSALQEHYKRSGRAADISTVLSLMYFPSEAFIERLREDDRPLYQYLQEKEILLVGPTMLFGVCGLARTKLAEVTRAEEHEAIIEAVSQLMENVVAVIDTVGGMGRGIKTLSDNYNKMVGLINRNALVRMKRLGKLKVSPAKGKAIPAPLPTYEIIKHDEVLDLEAEEATGDEKVLSIR